MSVLPLSPDDLPHGVGAQFRGTSESHMTRPEGVAPLVAPDDAADADDEADPIDAEIARLVRNALRFPSTREAKLSQLRHAARQILDVLDPNPERVDDDPALDRVALLWLAFGDLLAFERSRAVVVASDAR